MQIPTNVYNIMAKLEENDFEAYLVGGAPRDIFEGKEPKDYDIFTNASGSQILNIFPDGVVIGGEERQQKILTVIVNGVEVSQYRLNGDRTEVGNNIHEHLDTCDFNINAIAMDKNGNVIDNKHTKKGVSNLIFDKVLETCGIPESRIAEDKLRIFRAIRFAEKYNLSIEVNLQDVITKTDISDIPNERICEELKTILTYNGSVFNMDLLDILEQIFPNITENLSGGKYHNETVGRHLMSAYEISCSITSDYRINLAALLHDYGKFFCYQYDEDGNISFPGHDKVGADKAAEVLKELKFSNDDIEFITFLIRNHMFRFKDVSNKKACAFFDKLHKYNVAIEDFMIILYADNQGNLAKPRIKFADFLRDSDVYNGYKQLLKEKKPFGLKDLEINGKDVINQGIQEGKVIGEMLNEVLYAVQEGEVKPYRPFQLQYLKEMADIYKR